jgi:DNA-binding transcriptional regulator PaaX
VLVSATVDLEAAAEVIARVRDRSGGPGGVLLTRGALGDVPGVLDDGSLARRSSSLEIFEERYAAFVAGFTPFLELPPIDDRLALKLRLLVVAEFRRIVLADPGLPAGLLPADWSGFEARRVASLIHSVVAERGEAERDRLVEWAPEGDHSPVQARRFLSVD